MRFRCPSSTPDGDAEPINKPAIDKRLSRMTLSRGKAPENVAGPSKKHQKKTPQNEKRKRSGMDATKKREIEMAHRREQIRRQLKKREWSYVFVGNVEPTADECALHNLFIKCGPISRIQIRCSQGRAITIGQAIPAHLRTVRDRQYATIEFVNPNSVRKALKLDGTRLHGTQLVVCLTAADLPEVANIVYSRLGRVQGAQHPRNPRSDGVRCGLFIM